MNRIVCQHGMKLEKNMRCDHGYIQAFKHYKGRTLCNNFGLHTKEAQAICSIFLAEQRKAILERKIGIEPQIPSKTFAEVASLWFSIWKKEKHPDGRVKHNEQSCYNVWWTIAKVLIPAFGKQNYNEISEKHIYQFRENYLDNGRAGTTANRYQAVLSSIFSHVAKWVQCEKIRPSFKLPVCKFIDQGNQQISFNPCDAVEMAPTNKRERILTKYEAGKLKNAFMQLNDADGWEICKLALKSVLSMKDLKSLEIGQEIDIQRSKTGVPVNLPIIHLVKLDWYGWRTRWDAARVLAGFAVWGKKGTTGRAGRCAKQCTLQFRDLRKTGINWLKGRHDLKLISEYAGHADIKTTEKAYTIRQSEYLEPLARDIESQVDAI